jgi:exopolysaccharide biosynthesis polyprenyl glycosylphosphotransferase
VSDHLASLAPVEPGREFAWLTHGQSSVRRRADVLWSVTRVFTDTVMLNVATFVTGAAGLMSLSAGWRILATVLTVCALAAAGTYAPRMRLDLPRELTRALAATSLALMGFGALALVFGHQAEAGNAAVVHWFAVAALVSGGRVGIHHVQRAVRSRVQQGAATVIVGAGVVGHTIAKRLMDEPGLGLTPVGFLDKDPFLAPEERLLRGLPELPVLGASWDLEDVLERHDVEHVVVAFSTAPTPVTLDIVRRCWQRGINVMLVPRLFEVEGRRMEVEHLGGLPLISVRSSDPRGWQFVVKYTLDRLIAAPILLLLSPLMALIALGVLVTMGRPLLFRQTRVGLDGKAFEMLKFRTMRGTPDDAGEANETWAAGVLGVVQADGSILTRSDRRTPFGRFLRAFSLDELPQLWNVLRGDMSLIGPRPELPHYVERFDSAIYRYPDRHRVKSGLTGWAQVNGLRGETSLTDRIEWDNFYIENWSPWLDLKIALRTLPALISRRGT